MGVPIFELLLFRYTPILGRRTRQCTRPNDHLLPQVAELMLFSGNGMFGQLGNGNNTSIGDDPFEMPPPFVPISEMAVSVSVNGIGSAALFAILTHAHAFHDFSSKC